MPVKFDIKCVYVSYMTFTFLTCGITLTLRGKHEKNTISDQKTFKIMSSRKIFSKPDPQIVSSRTSVLSGCLFISGETHKEHMMKSGEFACPKEHFVISPSLRYFAIQNMIFTRCFSYLSQILYLFFLKDRYLSI